MADLNTLNELTDEALMMCVQDGDHQAFSVLVKRHTQKFFNLSFRILHVREDAEDVVQLAFTKLWQKPQTWSRNKGAKFTTWFYRVIHNASIDELRRKKPQMLASEVTDMQADKTESVEYKLQKEETNSQLEQAIRDLPERQQTALSLFYFEDVSQKDAASIMGVSVKAFESLLSRAKTGLKNYYEQSFGETQYG